MPVWAIQQLYIKSACMIDPYFTSSPGGYFKITVPQFEITYMYMYVIVHIADIFSSIDCMHKMKIHVVTYLAMSK